MEKVSGTDLEVEFTDKEKVTGVVFVFGGVEGLRRTRKR